MIEMDPAQAQNEHAYAQEIPGPVACICALGRERHRALAKTWIAKRAHWSQGAVATTL